MRTYLVPIANQQSSLSAFWLACLKAKRTGGKVVLLHVVSPPDEQTPFTIIDMVREERKGAAQAFLLPLKSEAETAFGITVDVRINEGVIHEQIIKEITAETVFIALCRDHQHGSGELLEWLVSHLDSSLHVPLMVVPAGLSNAQRDALA